MISVARGKDGNRRRSSTHQRPCLDLVLAYVLSNANKSGRMSAFLFTPGISMHPRVQTSKRMNSACKNQMHCCCFFVLHIGVSNATIASPQEEEERTRLLALFNSLLIYLTNEP